MASSHPTIVSEKLAALFRNGVPQVGLEAGTDAGLDPNEYIQIPRSMAKAWAYREPGDDAYNKTPDDTTKTLAGKKGWTVVKASDDKMRVHGYGGPSGATWYVTKDTKASGERIYVDDIHVDAHTYDDLRRFIVANGGHVREAALSATDIPWVHATRFWAVVTGLVVGSKNKEFTFVDDPTDDLATVNDIAAFTVDFMANGLTACAARATNWRRSNHATGGELAVSFPQRWLQQMKIWPEGNMRTDAAVTNRAKAVTSAFYVATHAAAVHNTLILMAPTDEGHWATIEPRWGMTFTWDILTSTQVRIAPKTQVAGTAMVVDAMVVFKTMTEGCLSPLLQNFEQWRALKAQVDIVKRNGVRVASYAQWFLDGHPEGLEKVGFNQKDSVCSALVGELAVVARAYYSGASIADSMALANAERQLANEHSKDLWNALGKERKNSSSEAVIRAYRRIMGATATTFIANMISDDPDLVRGASNSYNESLAVAAAGIGLDIIPALSVENVIDAMGEDEDDDA